MQVADYVRKGGIQAVARTAALEKRREGQEMAQLCRSARQQVLESSRSAGIRRGVNERAANHRGGLSNAPAVTAIVSDRIYYSVAPQGAQRPYAVLIGSVERDETLLAGQSQYPEGLISIACYADTFPGVENLGNAIIAALQDASGTWRGRAATIMRDDVDGFDFLPGDRVHRRIVGFAVRYR
jgi:hypothetical protein